MRSLPLLVLCLMVSGSSASANILIDLVAAPTPAGSNFTYEYSARLENHKLYRNDSFTIYDFFGFVSAAAMPGGWSFTAESITAQSLTNVPDDPNIPNLRWTYKGSPITSDMTFTPFRAISTIGVTGGSPYYTAWSAGGRAGNIGQTVGPVPEPGSIVLFSAGIGTMVLLHRRRKSA